jgi:lipopolysaccharide transport system permease protein
LKHVGNTVGLRQDLGVLRRSRALVWVMARREIAARYAGSAGGVVWAYAPPLLTVASYFLVFDLVFGMRLGDAAPVSRVGTYLIVGMLAWMAFSDALARAASSLVEAGSVLQKNALPPAVFPARAVLASAVVYAPLMLVLVPAYAPWHGFSAALLALPVLLVLQWMLSFALGYLMAILAAAMRDTTHLLGLCLSLGVFLSPVLFPVTLFPEGWRWVLWINPMTGPVLGYQSILLQGIWPPVSVWLALVGWIALVGVLLNLGVRRSREQLVDWL